MIGTASARRTKAAAESRSDNHFVPGSKVWVRLIHGTDDSAGVTADD